MANGNIALRTQPQRRNRQYEKRLASILRAASRIIARDGFEGASVRDVAAAAGVNLSSLYYYFTNKDELLYTLQRRTFEALVHNLKQRLEQCTTAEERLRAVISSHFELFAGNIDDLKLCVHEIESLSGRYYREVLEIRREYFRLVQKVVGEFVGRSRSKTDITALCLFGSLNWMYMWFDREKNADIKKLTDQYMDIFLNGIDGQ
ncbi:MAG: TetR/AcrR family transcriptional regulator [Candidatus Zixiibacteriota bacterium]